MRISNPFRYQFREPARPTSCILKLWFGKRYFILKAKSATQSVNAISQELDRRLRLGAAEDHIYYHIVTYIRRARISLFEVEVVFESDRPLDLLKKEFTELRMAQSDENCLNNYFDAYIAKWIPADVVKKFETWKKSLTKKKSTKKNAKPATTKNAKAVSARTGSGKERSVPNVVRGSAGTRRKKEDPSAV